MEYRIECRIFCDLWIREFVEIGLNFRFECLIFEKKINFGRREEMMLWGRERERERKNRRKGGGEDFAAEEAALANENDAPNPALGLASARAGPRRYAAVCLTIQ